MKILDNGKKLLSNWSQKHFKLLTVLYTLIVLIVGILIGGHYEGQDKDGTYYSLTDAMEDGYYENN